MGFRHGLACRLSLGFELFLCLYLPSLLLLVKNDIELWGMVWWYPNRNFTLVVGLSCMSETANNAGLTDYRPRVRRASLV